MPAAPRPNTTPDYLTVPAGAQVVVDACEFYATHVEKIAQEVGQTRVMAPIVQMARRAAHQTRGYAEDDQLQ